MPGSFVQYMHRGFDNRYPSCVLAHYLLSHASFWNVFSYNSSAFSDSFVVVLNLVVSYRYQKNKIQYHSILKYKERYTKVKQRDSFASATHRKTRDPRQILRGPCNFIFVQLTSILSIASPRHLLMSSGRLPQTPLQTVIIVFDYFSIQVCVLAW